MKKVIIFGGYGFVGNELYINLYKKKFQVFRYRNKIYSNKKNSIFYTCRNFEKKIKKIKPDYIYFLSGNSYPNNSFLNSTLDFKSNNMPLQELLHALKSIKFKGPLIYTSSIAVYGNSTKKLVKENEKLNPCSNYALSKEIAEKQLLFFSRNFGIKSICLRLCSIYGPGLKRQIIYDLITKIKSKKQIKLHGHKHDKRQFLFVEDCAEMLSKFCKKNIKANFNIFNISGGNLVHIKAIAKEIQGILKINKKVVFLNKVKSPNLPSLSNFKFLKKFGQIKFTPLKLGLIKTIKIK